MEHLHEHDSVALPLPPSFTPLTLSQPIPHSWRGQGDLKGLSLNKAPGLNIMYHRVGKPTGQSPWEAIQPEPTDRADACSKEL